MSNRWLRFGIALLALGAAAAAGYRVVEQEQRLASEIQAARLVDGAAETALTTVSELKAALHAYVAEGQGHAFWTARAATLIDRLRGSILELDGAAAVAGLSLADTLDLTDRVAASEQRARQHARTGERLLAGEVVFVEARDLLDAIRLQVAAIRSAVADRAETAAADIRRQQAMLSMGAAGVLAFAMLLLVIPGRSEISELPSTLTTRPHAPETPDAFESSARVVSRVPLTPNARVASAAPPAPGAPGTGAAPQAPGALSAPGAPGAPRSSVSLRDAAAVCTDLGRVSQSAEIAGLLDRAAKVLNATGVIVWLSSADGRELYPAASAGYDARLLARIGSIPREASNVTAGALRDAAPRTSPSTATSAAALAVPLLTPLGPVGVLSAEIREIRDVDEARLAVAVIFAAQLASLLGSMPVQALPPIAAEQPTSQAKAQA